MKKPIHCIRIAALLFSFLILSTENSGAQEGGTGIKGLPKKHTNPPGGQEQKSDSIQKAKDAAKTAVTITTPASASTLSADKVANNSIIAEAKQPEPASLNADQTDTALTKAQNEAWKAYYHAVERENVMAASVFDATAIHDNWALANRRSIIERQHTTGIVIFALVLLLVLSGLLFSALQFRIALKSIKKKGVTPDTSFKASLAGIEVSSSILGVIILALSIVFFYLYLINVFPIVTLKE